MTQDESKIETPEYHSSAPTNTTSPSPLPYLPHQSGGRRRVGSRSTDHLYVSPKNRRYTDPYTGNRYGTLTHPLAPVEKETFVSFHVVVVKILPSKGFRWDFNLGGITRRSRRGRGNVSPVVSRQEGL